MINGEIYIRGDKSISHRILMLSSIISNTVIISNISKCQDVESTIDCLEKCGASIIISNSNICVNSSELINPNEELNCGNSGTTLRLMLGLLAGKGIEAIFVGDSSLSKRPMDRVIRPLSSMGANIISNKTLFPIKLLKSELSTVSYILDVPSAQVKSSILLSDFKNIVIDNYKTRDHTERMIEYIKLFNASDDIYYSVPGDISSASFFIVLALICPNSKIIIKDVLYNKTRNGILDVLENMNAKIDIRNVRDCNGEFICDIFVSYSPNLISTELDCNIYSNIIDEIPIFAAAAVFANGETIIKNAQELKYKESDRLDAIFTNLKNMGIKINKIKNGLIINGRNMYNTINIDSDDHRIIMMIEVLNIAREGKGALQFKNEVSISFPEFYEILDRCI